MIVAETVSDFRTFDFHPSFTPIDAVIKTDTRVPPKQLESFQAQATHVCSERPMAPDFEITFKSFDLKFSFDVSEVEWGLDENEIVLLLNHANIIHIRATLAGIWTLGDTPLFDLKGFNLSLERKTSNPLSVFVASTLWALIGVGTKLNVRIPALEFEFSAGFQLSLTEVRKLVAERQVAERLMIIEDVLKTHLPIPPNFIDAKDVESIAFCYHTIVEHTFQWRSKEITFYPLATKEYLAWLPETDRTFQLKFPTIPEERIIFGKKLVLGQFYVEVEKARIANYDEAIRSMLSLNGEPVKVVIRPADAKIRYIGINTPQFDPSVLSVEIRMLLGVEKKLDEIMVTKYFEMFSSTLEGLNSEQRATVAKRPKRLAPVHD